MVILLTETSLQHKAEITSEDLWQILARQTALYTNMEGESVPVEVAEELLKSVLFCMEIGGDLLSGQRMLTQKTEAAKRLYMRAKSGRLPLEAAVYREDLREYAKFFTWYDIRFMAHEIPCMLSYPLAIPVPETLQGIDYITEHLNRRIWEDDYLRQFPLAYLRKTLNKRVPGWQILPLNMCGGVIDDINNCYR
jgi:hypothetical protein